MSASQWLSTALKSWAITDYKSLQTYNDCCDALQHK